MAAKPLPMDQMYHVLRGLPGTMPLNAPDGDEYRLTIVNPNAPANRCQETLGLSVTLDGPQGWSSTRALTEEELETLRSGDPLPLMFNDVEVVFQSNPGGYLVNLDGDEHGAESG